MTTQAIPEELYSKKSLFSLSGAAGAVWLVCMVIATLDEDHNLLNVTVYKFIALGLSMFMAVYMVLRDKRKTRMENYLFAFFNGLLIFINASGINAISNNVAKLASIPKQETVIEQAATSDAAFFAISLFKNEVDWWPNKKQEQRIAQLEEQLNYYKNLDDSAAKEDALKQEFVDYKIKVEEHIKDITSRLRDCQTNNSNQQDPTGAVQTDPKLTTELENCKKSLEGITNRAKTILEENRSLKAKLKACEKTKKKVIN